MKKIGILFSGQGSQTTGMFDFINEFESSKIYIDELNTYYKKDIIKTMESNDIEFINDTKNTQPLLFAASLIRFKILEESGIEIAAVGGLSLGEITALVSSKSLSLSDGMDLVVKRGDLMSVAAKETNGSMVAVIGLSEEQILEAIKPLQKNGVIEISNFNGYGQIVVGGETSLINDSIKLLKDAGAKIVIPLKVSGAFHTELFKGAANKYLKFLNDYEFKKPNADFYTNTTGKKITKNFKENIVAQIHSSVMLTQMIENMISDGINIFIEIGPGKTITNIIKKMNKKINKEIELYSTNDSNDIKLIVEEVVNNG